MLKTLTGHSLEQFYVLQTSVDRIIPNGAESIVIDGSQTNKEAILICDKASRHQDRSRRKLKPVRIRQGAYLKNRTEQDHHAIKWRIRPMLGFQSTASARVILVGIEMVRMMRKGRAKYACTPQPSLTDQFDLLAT